MHDIITRNGSGKYALNPRAVFIEYMKSKDNHFDYLMYQNLNEKKSIFLYNVANI